MEYEDMKRHYEGAIWKAQDCERFGQYGGEYRVWHEFGSRYWNRNAFEWLEKMDKYNKELKCQEN